MGTYLDPGNTGFKSFPAADYTYRSGLIALINDTIDTEQRFTCIAIKTFYLLGFSAFASVSCAASFIVCFYAFFIFSV